ncbi:MAG: hypothetical protein JXA87_06770 [Thermoleophilia bacterium]|nr:hypothetical protein [Thermoleophilia bacterium]
MIHVDNPPAHRLENLICADYRHLAEVGWPLLLSCGTRRTMERLALWIV